MQSLSAVINRHFDATARYIATLEEHNRELKLQIVRLEMEMERLRRIEVTIRTMGQADHAVNQALRLIDAGC